MACFLCGLKNIIIFAAVFNMQLNEADDIPYNIMRRAGLDDRLHGQCWHGATLRGRQYLCVGEHTQVDDRAAGTCVRTD